MTLRCKLCEQEFKSLLIDQTKACREVSTKLAMHISDSKEERHKQLYQEVGAASSEIMAGVAWLLVLKGAEIPEDEEFIFAEQERFMEMIGDWLGTDDTEESESEEPTPEGLAELLDGMVDTDYGLGSEDVLKVVEYVFGPQDAELETEPKPESQTPTPTKAKSLA